jgi:hypothetical protein
MRKQLIILSNWCQEVEGVENIVPTKSRRRINKQHEK